MDEQQVQKDIEAMVKYLKVYQPENATTEYAAAMLDTIQSTFHDIALNDPEKLFNLYESTRTDIEE